MEDRPELGHLGDFLLRRNLVVLGRTPILVISSLTLLVDSILVVIAYNKIKRVRRKGHIESRLSRHDFKITSNS